jgi:hypothetical protein
VPTELEGLSLQSMPELPARFANLPPPPPFTDFSPLAQWDPVEQAHSQLSEQQSLAPERSQLEPEPPEPEPPEPEPEPELEPERVESVPVIDKLPPPPLLNSEPPPINVAAMVEQAGKATQEAAAAIEEAAQEIQRARAAQNTLLKMRATREVLEAACAAEQRRIDAAATTGLRGIEPQFLPPTDSDADEGSLRGWDTKYYEIGTPLRMGYSPRQQQEREQKTASSRNSNSHITKQAAARTSKNSRAQTVGPDDLRWYADWQADESPGPQSTIAESAPAVERAAKTDRQPKKTSKGGLRMRIPASDEELQQRRVRRQTARRSDGSQSSTGPAHRSQQPQRGNVASAPMMAADAKAFVAGWALGERAREDAIASAERARLATVELDKQLTEAVRLGLTTVAGIAELRQLAVADDSIVEECAAIWRVRVEEARQLTVKHAARTGERVLDQPGSRSSSSFSEVSGTLQHLELEKNMHDRIEWLVARGRQEARRDMKHSAVTEPRRLAKSADKRKAVTQVVPIKQRRKGSGASDRTHRETARWREQRHQQLAAGLDTANEQQFEIEQMADDIQGLQKEHIEMAGLREQLFDSRLCVYLNHSHIS